MTQIEHEQPKLVDYTHVLQTMDPPRLNSSSPGDSDRTSNYESNVSDDGVGGGARSRGLHATFYRYGHLLIIFVVIPILCVAGHKYVFLPAQAAYREAYPYNPQVHDGLSARAYHIQV